MHGWSEAPAENNEAKTLSFYGMMLPFRNMGAYVNLCSTFGRLIEWVKAIVPLGMFDL